MGARLGRHLGCKMSYAHIHSAAVTSLVPAEVYSHRNNEVQRFFFFSFLETSQNTVRSNEHINTSSSEHYRRSDSQLQTSPELTTLSMSFQVFSTVRRSAAACFGGPTASWMASMKPRIRPLLLFGPRPPGFRPLRAVAMSYTLWQDRGRLQSVTAVYKPITHEGGNVFQIILLHYTVHDFILFFG